MSKILRNLSLALVLLFGTVTAFSSFIDVPVAEAAGKKKGKASAKMAKKAKKGKKATKVASWKHCGTFMYHDKKGKCVDARAKK